MAEYISKFDTSEGAKQVDYNALGNLPSIPSKTSDLNNDSNFISSPVTAEVGQVLEVEAVDEVGKPTSWKVVNMPESLPNPHALTFTGAVTDTYNGSEAKTIEIPSVSGVGSDEWKYTETVLIENVSSCEFDFNNITKMHMRISSRANDADNSLNSGSTYFSVLINGKMACRLDCYIRSSNCYVTDIFIFKINDKIRFFSAGPFENGIVWQSYKNVVEFGSKMTDIDDALYINKIEIKTIESGYLLGSGSEIKIWYA